MTTPPPPPGFSPAESRVVAALPSTRRAESEMPPAAQNEDETALHVDTEASEVTSKTPTPDPTSSYTSERLTTLRNAATWYAETHGLVVVPCHYPRADGTCSCGNGCGKDAAKHPSVKAGYHNNPDLQAVSRSDVERLWSSEPWNIAILLGPARGVIAFDVDERSGGLESIEQLKNDLRDVIDFDATYHYNTSSGGIHYYFKIDVDDRAAWSDIVRLKKNLVRYSGIDYKFGKGYTIAAPSQHISGDMYTKPKNAPSTITELTQEDIARMSAALGGGAQKRSTALGSWTSMVESSTSELGVSFGGSLDYSTSIRDMVGGEDGSFSRVLSHFLATGSVPEDEYRLQQGQQNTTLQPLIGRVASFLFRDPALSGDFYYLWKKSGGTLGSGRRNRVFPYLYRLICETLSQDLCDPAHKPYHQAEPTKFYGMMNDLMFKEWANNGFEV